MLQQTLSQRTEFGYGFDAPRAGRVYDKPPDDPLYKAFEEWLKKTPKKELLWDTEQEKHYQRALGIAKKIQVIEKMSSTEIGAVLLPYQSDARIRNAGLFLSACYNLIDEQNLVWDIDTETRIDHIGYKIGEGRGLILKADCGKYAGTRNDGIVCNFGSVNGMLGFESEAPTINFGTVKQMAVDAKCSAINFGSVKSLATRSKGHAINLGDVEDWIAWDAQDIQTNITLKHVRGIGLCRNGEICLDEDDAKKYPRLITHFEQFKREGEAYRNAGFPECLGVLDVIKQFVGSTNEEFMEKLRGLLD